jgi:eukaryotic-like serine/threonine-protein kinase
VTKDVTAPDSGRRFGRYEVQREIGEGAMGRVYQAFDPLVRRVVAIKTVKPEFLTKDTAEHYLRRFRREAQAAGQLSHPNIVGVYDVGEDYFVMEFVEGINLQSLLAQRAPLPLGEALRILSPIAEAIDYAHRFRVFHRDIKPGNIMILGDGRPKLMDFGVARLSTSVVTGSGQTFGSPSYMAPEQIVDDTVVRLTPGADLFSFGVVAYEALTGQRPFHGDSIAATIYQVVHEPAPPPRSLNENLPPHHDDVFHRALAKRPENRYPDGLSFVTDLSGEAMTLPEALPAPIPVASTAIVALSPPAVSTPVPAAATPFMVSTLVPVGALETRLLRRRADGSLEPDDSAPPRRWLPWAVAAAALLAVGAEIVALRRAGPIPAAETRRVPSLPAGLRLETRPPGASVWIDGRVAGEAPLTMRDLRPGVHQLRVAEEGYAPAELTLEIPQGTSVPLLRFVLAPLHTPTEIFSDPAAAAVTVDGRPIGTTPIGKLTLGPGSHTIRLEREHFLPAVKEVEARPGVKLVVRVRLDRAPANPTPTPLPTPKPVVEGDLVDLDDSVRPPRLIAGERVAYPKEARRLRLQGTVSVEVIVDEKGVPHDARVLQSAGAILDEAVIEAVYKFRYDPATKRGVRVKVRQTYSQTLSL